MHEDVCFGNPAVSLSPKLVMSNIYTRRFLSARTKFKLFNNDFDLKAGCDVVAVNKILKTKFYSENLSLNRKT